MEVQFDARQAKRMKFAAAEVMKGSRVVVSGIGGLIYLRVIGADENRKQVDHFKICLSTQPMPFSVEFPGCDGGDWFNLNMSLINDRID